MMDCIGRIAAASCTTAAFISKVKNMPKAAKKKTAKKSPVKAKKSASKKKAKK